MTSKLVRFERYLMTVLLLIFLLSAVFITGLRFLLPSLNQHQEEIEQFLSETTELSISIDEVKGRWRNTNPSINLSNVIAIDPDSGKEIFSVGEIEIQLNILSSLWAKQFQFADFRMNELDADFTFLQDKKTKIKEVSNKETGEKKFIQRLKNIFLVQMEHFSVKNSDVTFIALNGIKQTVHIDKLQWKNKEDRHFAEAIVNLVDSDINQLKIIANFKDADTWNSLDGDFFVKAESIKLTPWLREQIQEKYNVTQGEVSINAWLSLNNGQPVDALVEALPSYISWEKDGVHHDIELERGIFKLEPEIGGKGWRVAASDIQILYENKLWSNLSGVFLWRSNGWTLNIDQIGIQDVLTLKTLFLDSKEKLFEILAKLEPKGLMTDIRLKYNKEEMFTYSAFIHNAEIKHWEWLPSFHKLNVFLSGNNKNGRAELSLVDDILPYEHVFQAPLDIQKGAVSLYWKLNDEGWQLWSDYISVLTPDLHTEGEFRLDFPNDEPATLSLYGEADLFDIGKTWRYLPKPVLDPELTDYLSRAIQGGKVNRAQILLYGELTDFPFEKYDGIFQIDLSVEEGKFTFDTGWPLVTDLKLDLLFQNASMFLTSNSADLMGIHADRIVGNIDELGPNGKLVVEAELNAEGKVIREYMNASPLVDSVGVALNDIHVDNPVNALLRISLPFKDLDVRAWGHVELSDNRVELQSPNVLLTHAKGRIEFDNDKVKASQIKAELLEQPIILSFDGELVTKSETVKTDVYNVDIATEGVWNIDDVRPYLNFSKLDKVSGRSAWKSDINVKLSDIDIDYHIDLDAGLEGIESQLPYPLVHDQHKMDNANLQVIGDSSSFSGRLTLPDMKYQADVSLTKEKPVIISSNVIIGEGSFKPQPMEDHTLSIKVATYDVDQWFNEFENGDLYKGKETSNSTEEVVDWFPSIPKPTQVQVDVKELKLGNMTWNDVDMSLRKKSGIFYFEVDSQEVMGKATWGKDKLLRVQLSSLHIFNSELDKLNENGQVDYFKEEEAPLISEFDKKFFSTIPNFDLSIKDAWVQGYKLGKMDMELRKQENRLLLNTFSVVSGDNKLDIDGYWQLTEKDSFSSFNIKTQGNNNSELLSRFGISSGIQNATYDMSGELSWKGAPWSRRIDTFSGEVKAELGEGTIADINGAARFLGIFSIDSIINKMKLDFRDVFDDGMAFNSIEGTGKIYNGIFVSNDLTMDAVAGKMKIQGKANLNTRTIDAEVVFNPNFASGIPILSAFAVTPQTAIILLAVSTAISPVISVVTQVEYSIKGPIESPTVTELSRSQGEYKLPDSEE